MNTKKILQTLELAETELKSCYRKLGITDSNVLKDVIEAQEQVKNCSIPVVRRSAYEKGLHSKIREINNDTQLLLERWDELKDLEYSSEHRVLFNAMKEFIEVHCA